MENSNAGNISLNTFDARIEKVREYLENNDLDGAKLFLSKFLTVDPNHPHACFIMAQILESEGNFKDAAEFYEKVCNPDMPDEILQRIINVYENADKYENVYNIYKTIEARQPDKDIYERLAHICCILNRDEEAIEYYNKILSSTPDDIVALKQLAVLYENTNAMMFHLTQAKIAQLEENNQKAESEYKKALAGADKDEDVLQIRYNLAKLYRQMNKYENALDEYVYILSATEENFSVFMELAQIYEELNNSSAAISVLVRALKIYPDNLEALQFLGELQLDYEQLEQAEKTFEKLVSLKPENIEFNVSLAKIYLKSGKNEETRNLLLKVEKIDSNNTEVLTALAGFYTYTGETDKAKQYCTRIIQKLPNSPLGYRKLAQYYESTSENYLAHFNFGLYHELKGETEDAINEFTWALQYNPDDYESIRKLAGFYEQQEEYMVAADYYQKLAEANIDIVPTTKALAKIYMGQNDYEIANRYIEDAISQNKDCELVLLHAKCLHKLKNTEEALAEYKYYLENTKSCEDMEEIENIVKKLEDNLSEPQSFNPLSFLFRFLDK